MFVCFPWRSGTVVFFCGGGLLSRHHPERRSTNEVEATIEVKLSELQRRLPEIEKMLEAKVTPEQSVWEVELAPSATFLTPVWSILDDRMPGTISLEHLTGEPLPKCRHRKMGRPERFGGTILGRDDDD